MREIRTLRATWRGLETWCGSGPPGHTGAPALDPTDERGWETGRWPKAQATAPILDSTIREVNLIDIYVVSLRHVSLGITAMTP
jgi:hypothetical protein